MSVWPIDKANVEKANFETVDQPLTELEKAKPRFAAITTEKTEPTSTVEQRVQAAKDNVAALAAAKAAEEANADQPAADQPAAPVPEMSSARLAVSATAGLLAVSALML